MWTKTYKPEILNGMQIEELVNAFYVLKSMDGIFKPTVSIVNANPRDRDKYTHIQRDEIALTTTASDRVSIGKFRDTYAQNKMGIIATLYLDRENFQKVGIQLVPENMAYAIGRDKCFVMVFNQKADKKLSKFLRDWVLAYKKFEEKRP